MDAVLTIRHEPLECRRHVADHRLPCDDLPTGGLPAALRAAARRAARRGRGEAGVCALQHLAQLDRVLGVQVESAPPESRPFRVPLALSHAGHVELCRGHRVERVKEREAEPLEEGVRGEGGAEGVGCGWIDRRAARAQEIALAT